MIYIGGKPFVLRDADTPKQNIRRYAGISADRLEQMETRLRDDVVTEAQRCNGLILVHDELGTWLYFCHSFYFDFLFKNSNFCRGRDDCAGVDIGGKGADVARNV